MNEEERAKKMEQISERDRESMKKAMVQAAYQVFKAAELELTQSRKEGGTAKLVSCFRFIRPIFWLTETSRRRGGNFPRGMKC